MNLRSRTIDKWVNKHLDTRCKSCWCTKCSRIMFCSNSCEDCEKHLYNGISKPCGGFTTVKADTLPTQKVIRMEYNGYKWAECPLCHDRVDDHLEEDFPGQCYCGQHLDWSD